jgi:hypothetical protein
VALAEINLIAHCISAAISRIPSLFAQGDTAHERYADCRGKSAGEAVSALARFRSGIVSLFREYRNPRNEEMTPSRDQEKD